MSPAIKMKENQLSNFRVWRFIKSVLFFSLETLVSHHPTTELERPKVYTAHQQDPDMVIYRPITYILFVGVFSFFLLGFWRSMIVLLDIISFHLVFYGSILVGPAPLVNGHKKKEKKNIIEALTKLIYYGDAGPIEINP